jgi:catechol 2,3-dioxygenase-like lactoylglutathione lyase family enzyme
MPVLPQGTVKGLAEVVLRVKDLDAMQAFYGDVLGLILLKRFGDDMSFFKLPNGSRESPQTLALFSEKWQANVPDAPWGGLERSTTTLHHFTLSVSLSDLFKARELLTSAQVPTHGRTFTWAGWRSLMIADPEGNVVELVASDPSIHEPMSD